MSKRFVPLSIVNKPESAGAYHQEDELSASQELTQSRAELKNLQGLVSRLKAKLAELESQTQPATKTRKFVIQSHKNEIATAETEVKELEAEISEAEPAIEEPEVSGKTKSDEALSDLSNA